MEFELINVLGKAVSAPEVETTIAKHGLTVPKSGSRRYFGSKKLGFDLLAESAVCSTLVSGVSGNRSA